MTNGNELKVKGKIVDITKLSCIYVVMGKVKDLKPLTGVIERKDDNVIITSVDHLDGFTPNNDEMAVVKVYGGVVLHDGLFDIVTIPATKISELVSNTIDITQYLASEQLDELAPLILSGSAFVPSYQGAIYGLKGIIITSDMLDGNEYIECNDTRFYEGDVYLIYNEENFTGIKLTKGEFKKEYMIQPKRVLYGFHV